MRTPFSLIGGVHIKRRTTEECLDDVRYLSSQDKIEICEQEGKKGGEQLSIPASRYIQLHQDSRLLCNTYMLIHTFIVHIVSCNMQKFICKHDDTPPIFPLSKPYDLLCSRLVVNDKVTKQVWTRAFKQNIVKKAFQQKDLEGKVSGVEASEPSLSFLQ